MNKRDISLFYLMDFLHSKLFTIFSFFIVSQSSFTISFLTAALAFLDVCFFIKVHLHYYFGGEFL